MLNLTFDEYGFTNHLKTTVGMTIGGEPLPAGCVVYVATKEESSKYHDVYVVSGDTDWNNLVMTPDELGALGLIDL